MAPPPTQRIHAGRSPAEVRSACIRTPRATQQLVLGRQVLGVGEADAGVVVGAQLTVEGGRQVGCASGPSGRR